MVNPEENSSQPSDCLHSLPPITATADTGPLTQSTSILGLEQIGETIGSYKLLRVLGEGGFGIVYLAEQRQPIFRKVALKIIKPGMDSKQVIARFEAERQALALLDHPHIATVLHAGTTEKGRPYFVMDYIQGIPITTYCDQHKLNIAQRLRLFKDVCDAIQHAHQKGIIHRDIKPSNILVTTQDEKAVPVVIDFGIAKAINQRLTEKTLVTYAGQFIGTPEYMSPEQAEMTSEQIDTRSDIYSLGVVLYELLIGALPFEGETLREGGVKSIRHILRKEEPETPSTKLSSMGDCANEVAACRQSDVKSLSRNLKKELEWIPLKAMRKEPERRYKTASDFSLDINNYLLGYPLEAGPESSVYLFKKFVRRHQFTSTVITLLALVISSAAFIGFYALTKMYQNEKRQSLDIQKYRQEITTHQKINNSIAQQLFTTLWLHQDWKGVLNLCHFLPDKMKESEAVIFIMDPRPVADKISPQIIPNWQQKSAFRHFILAESYWKDGQDIEAIKAYEQSISLTEDPNTWFLHIIQSRLNHSRVNELDELK